MSTYLLLFYNFIASIKWNLWLISIQTTRLTTLFYNYKIKKIYKISKRKMLFTPSYWETRHFLVAWDMRRKTTCSHGGLISTDRSWHVQCTVQWVELCTVPVYSSHHPALPTYRQLCRVSLLLKSQWNFRLQFIKQDFARLHGFYSWEKNLI